jgi:hypothetical protein
MPFFLLAFFLLSIALGCGALILVIGWWRLVEKWYWEWLPKLAVALARAVSGGSAIAIQVFAQQKGDWLEVQIAAIASYAIWEILGIIGDQRSKKTARTMERLEKEGLFRTKLLITLRALVAVKKQRIASALGQPGSAAAPIYRVREALSPQRQIALLLEHMAFFLRRQLPDTEASAHQNFRVGLYVAEDGVMRPLHAFDLKNQNHDPFQSYRHAEAHFRLDNATDPALVVQCVRERQLLIVSDCEQEAKRGTFACFDAHQRIYLKSLIAYPIFPFGRQAGTITPQAAIVIDTDVAGHFQEENRQALQFFMEEFAARFDMEVLLRELLETRG